MEDEPVRTTSKKIIGAGDNVRYCDSFLGSSRWIGLVVIQLSGRFELDNRAVVNIRANENKSNLSWQRPHWPEFPSRLKLLSDWKWETKERWPDRWKTFSLDVNQASQLLFTELKNEKSENEREIKRVGKERRRRRWRRWRTKTGPPHSVTRSTLSPPNSLSHWVEENGVYTSWKEAVNEANLSNYSFLQFIFFLLFLQYTTNPPHPIFFPLRLVRLFVVIDNTLLSLLPAPWTSGLTPVRFHKESDLMKGKVSQQQQRPPVYVFCVLKHTRFSVCVTSVTSPPWSGQGVNEDLVRSAVSGKTDTHTHTHAPIQIHVICQ